VGVTETVATPEVATLAVPSVTLPAVNVTLPLVAADEPAFTVAVKISAVPYVELGGATVRAVVVGFAVVTDSAVALDVDALKTVSPG
jgi:hypothetical protein